MEMMVEKTSETKCYNKHWFYENHLSATISNDL